MCNACYQRWWIKENPEKFKARVERNRESTKVHARRRYQEYRAAGKPLLRKEVRQAISRKYAATHREQNKARRKRYREENPEKEKSYRKQWYAANKERRLAYGKKWREENKERHKEMIKAWEQANAEHVRERSRRNAERRRSILVGLPATLTKVEWEAIKELYNHCCAYCGKSNLRLSQDHVIPVAKGGWYSADNIVPACRACNTRKKDGPPPPESLPLKFITTIPESDSG